VALRPPDDNVPDDTRSPSPKRTRTRRVVRALVAYVLPLVVLAAASAGALWFYRTAPKARRGKASRTSALVEIQTVTPGTHRAIVRAMGTVVATQEVSLQPQVSGMIVRLSPDFTPGGRVSADEVVAAIDPTEYQAVLDRAEAELAGNQAELASAAWELARLERLEKISAVNDKELDVAQTAKLAADAAVAAARASVTLARLDVERTTIRAPFNGVIVAKNVDLGAQVTSQTQLAALIGTDEYWVEVAVPVDRLSWIAIPIKTGQQGSPAVVYQGDDAHPETRWEGRVHRLRKDLEPLGRMARLLVTVSDPLGLKSSSPKTVPLLVGSYVHVAIEGRELQGVVAIPRSALRDGQRVWLMSEGSELVIRDVDIAWRDRDSVLVRTGLAAGDRLVTSDIATPVPGLPLREQDSQGRPVPRERVAERPG